MPKLSVIIPIYNTEKFLSRCIESIINQTFLNMEIILVNDGSTDNSLTICREYAGKDGRIKVIDKKNEGAGPTRNMGIEVASGEYLAFPDSDDRMELDAYERCIEIIEDSNVDLLVFGMKTEVYTDSLNQVEHIVLDEIPEREYQTAEEFRNNWTWLYKNMDMGSPCNKIYRKSIIDKYKLRFPNLRRMQDGVFNMYYYDKITSFKSISQNYFVRTWHEKEFQRKKMPINFVDCSIAHHRTLEEMLKRWGLYNVQDVLFFYEAFSETIITAEMDYFPSEKPTFQEIWRHIKKINTNEYIHSFYCEYNKLKKLRKREVAMMRKWNLLLAIELYFRAKKGD